MDSWTSAEKRILRSLSTPAKIQYFLNTIPFRIEGGNETCLSPRSVLRERKAQCVEGAMFAAAALRFHGYTPLIVDLEATTNDADHVIAVFQIDKHWGAISKTNHGVLRYREPIYKTIRELVMSYFHEYFLQSSRQKTLRTFSRPVDLSRFDRRGWETSQEAVWYIPEYLLTIPHASILNRKQIARLRKADPIEAAMAAIEEWPAE
ncbi:MAG: hypothetical protein AAB839_00860 [Patescibacteria group bacterium]